VKRRGIVGLVGAGGILLSGIAGAAGHMMSGTDVARLLPPTGARVEPYENDGYAMSFVEGGVEVRVDLAPIRSRAGFAHPSRAARGAIDAAAYAATASARDRYGAVSGVLSWVATHVRYVLDRAAPQDPRDVVARGTAYCTGVARLAVALLGSVGIEAREVPGYIFEDLHNGPRSGFHRWIEVWYPDRGWVFSDPLATQHFVPATYLRLAEESLAELPGGGKLLSRKTRSEEVDLVPGAPDRIRVRPNDDARRAAALVIRMEAATDAEAVLSRAGGERRRARIEDGEARFLGLETGRYELRVLAGGKVKAEKALIFRAPVLGEVRIPSRSAPGASGGMR
jgi:hypothetical protein